MLNTQIGYNQTNESLEIQMRMLGMEIIRTPSVLLPKICKYSVSGSPLPPTGMRNVMHICPYLRFLLDSKYGMHEALKAFSLRWASDWCIFSSLNTFNVYIVLFIFNVYITKLWVFSVFTSRMMFLHNFFDIMYIWFISFNYKSNLYLIIRMQLL